MSSAGEPVEDSSSSEEVAGLFLAVVDQGRLEIARQARAAQKPTALGVVSSLACTCLACSVSAQCWTVMIIILNTRALYCSSAACVHGSAYANRMLQYFAALSHDALHLRHHDCAGNCQDLPGVG